MMLDEGSNEDESLCESCFKNITELDFMVFLSLEEIQDVNEYFDANKQL